MPANPWIDWKGRDWGGFEQGQARQQQFAQRGYEELAGGKASYGEAMLQKGQAQAMAGMQSQAVARGANPAAERAAIMSGGQVAAQSAGQAAGIRAQEMAAARAQYQQSMQFGTQAELQRRGLEQQQEQARAEYYLGRGQLELGERGQNIQAIGVGLGAAGAMAGGMFSDSSLKTDVEQVAPEEQEGLARADRMASGLQQIGQQAAGMDIYGGMSTTAPTIEVPGAPSGPPPTIEPGSLRRPVQLEESTYLGGDMPQEYQLPAAQDRPMDPDELWARRRNAEMQRRYLADALATEGARTEAQLGANRPVYDDAVFSDEDLKQAIESASPEAQLEVARRMKPGAESHQMYGRAIQVSEQERGRWLGGARSMATAGAPREALRARSGLASTTERATRGRAEELDDQVLMAMREAEAGRDRPRRAILPPPGASATYEPAGASEVPGGGWASMTDEMARELELKRFRYRQAALAAGAPAGQRLGVMAQQLERTPLGRTAVVQTPIGKAIDRDQALGLALGLHGSTARRLDELEGKVERKD